MAMKGLGWGLVLLSLWWGQVACAQTSDESAIRALMTRQVSAWNNGDLDGFMAGYWRDDRLRFASGDRVTYGWQQTLDGYRKRYPDRKTMGMLDFDVLEVRVMEPTSALVFGRWQLTRNADRPHGLFTLLLRKGEEGWRIVADHTS